MLERMIRRALLILVVGALLALPVSGAGAQSTLPTVTIIATDRFAKEPADNGEFTVYRTNSPSLAALTVYYMISGTATNGVDYVALTGRVTIPAGAVSARIPVGVRDDNIREDTESVVATITDPCFGPVPCLYNIGSPRTAVVGIYDNDGWAPNP